MEEVDKYLLQCVSKNITERVEAYHSLTETLSSLPQASEWGRKTTKEHANQMIENIKEDILSSENNVCYEVTGFLGCLLANENLMDLLSLDEEQQIMNILIKLLKETKDTAVLSRGLWSLAQSKFECETYNKNIAALLDLINEVFQCDPSNIIIYETLQVLKSLMESIPEKMIDSIEEWFPKIFGYLFHDSLRVRGVTYSCLNYCHFYSQEKKCVHIINKHVVPFIPILKNEYLKQMVKLLEGNCTFVLKIWRLLIIILGQDLHSGSTLINGFLEVVEKAFKSSKPEVRIDAFKCWHVLINNFAADLEVLSHPKRLKLLVAPLKSNNAKTEDSSFIKLHTWWFLVCKLEGNTIKNFELVIIPLLKFCFDLTKASQSNVNERKLLISGSPTPCTKYPNLVLKSVEVLVNILNHEQSILSNFNVSTTHNILNNSLFLKNYTSLFGSIVDAVMSLDLSDEQHFKISHEILISTLKYINAILRDHYGKKESVDLLKEFLKIFDFFESECKPGDFLSLFCFDFVKSCLLGDESLPNNVLHSRYYYIPVGTKIRDIMNGNLSNYFVHKLCRPVLSHHASTDSRYLDLWEVLLEKDNSSNKLEFYEAAIEELKSVVLYLDGKNQEVIISIWALCTKSLNSYIDKTYQINQGDNSEHDWACIYNTLLFPIIFSENLVSVRDISYKKLMTVWMNLWNSFTTLATLVATAEPNCETEYFAKKLLTLIQEKLTSDSSGFTLSLLADVLCHITEKFRFKELGNKTKTALRSPLQPKKKPHPLSNLHSLLEVLISLMDKTLETISFWRHKSMLKICIALNKIYTNIFQQQRAWAVVSSVSNAMKLAVKVNPRAKFNTETERAFITMWNSFCGLIEFRIVPSITQEKLTFLSPMISAALQSSHTSLRQRTRLMWTTSFASMSLTIPESLLCTLKEIRLPPAYYDQDSQGDSQSLSPKNSKEGELITSTYQLSGKARFPLVSPKLDFKLKLSPLGINSKSPLPVKKTKVEEKSAFNIEELKIDDFVVVSSPKVKNRVFTAHQIEKMNERSVIPALYNDMSQSQSQITSDFSDYGSTIVSKSSKLIPKSSCPNLNFKGKINVETSPELSNTKTYSEEELDQVLKDTSFELEKSLSDSILILDSKESTDLRRSKRNRNTPTHNKEGCINNSNQCFTSSMAGLESNTLNKRKSHTPIKKSIFDIKKKLKGSFRKSTSPTKVEDKKERSDSLTKTPVTEVIDKKILFENNIASSSLSPLASPLRSPQVNQEVDGRDKTKNINNGIKSSKKHLFKCKKSTNNSSNKKSEGFELFDESHEEIPNSQTETPSFSILQPFKSLSTTESSNEKSFSSVSRPKRNKRKSIYENENIYITPPKRSKINPTQKSSDKLQELEGSLIQLDEKEKPQNNKYESIVSTIFNKNPSSNEQILQRFSENVQNENEEKIKSPIKEEKVHISCMEKTSDMCESLIVNETQSQYNCGIKESSLSKSVLDVIYQNSLSLTTPSKVTRSGRRVITPNKDMPEPMTSPGTKGKGSVIKDLSKENTNSVKEKQIISSSDLTTVEFNKNLDETQTNSLCKVSGVFSDVSISENSESSFSIHKKYGTFNSNKKFNKSIDELEIIDDHCGNIGNKLNIKKLSEVKVVLNEIGDKYSPKKSPMKGQINTKDNIENSLNKFINNKFLVGKEKDVWEESSLLEQDKDVLNNPISSKFLTENKSKILIPKPENVCLENSKRLFKKFIMSPKPLKSVSKRKKLNSFSKEFHLPSNGIIFSEVSENLFENLMSKPDSNCHLKKFFSLENISIFQTTEKSLQSLKPYHFIIPKIPNEKDNEKILIYKKASTFKTTNILNEEVYNFKELKKGHENTAPNLSVYSSSSERPIKNVFQLNLLSPNLHKDLRKSEDASLKEVSAKPTECQLPLKLNLSHIPRTNESSSLSPKIQGKKIFIITSPKSCSPIKKVVYSPQSDKKSRRNSQIFVVRKSTDDNQISIIDNNKPTDENHPEIIDINQNKEPLHCQHLEPVKEPIHSPEMTQTKELVSFLGNTTDIPVKENNSQNNISEDKLQENQSNKESNTLMEKKVFNNREKITRKKIKPAKKLKASKHFAKSLQQKIKLTQKLNDDSLELKMANKNRLKEENNKNNNDDKNDNKDEREKQIFSDKDSPNKENSKLSNSLGTPERTKLSMKRMQVPGSRAAIMLACARRTRRTKEENMEIEESPKARLLDEKSSYIDISSKFSPRSLTPKRRISLSNVLLEEKPWAKHEPSPTASPCGSILKKRHVEEYATVGEVFDQESPSISKCRRVSFADPPVSEKVEIPLFQHFKTHKAQKRLDMTQAIDSPSLSEMENSQSSQKEEEEISLDVPNFSQPLYIPLVGCLNPIENILPKLTSSSLIESLKSVFKDRKIRTIGDLCSISEKELTSLPVRSPKKANTIKCLHAYEESIKSKENDLENVDTVKEISKKDRLLSVNNCGEVSNSEMPKTKNNVTILDYGPDIDDNHEEIKQADPLQKRESPLTLSGKKEADQEFQFKDLQVLCEQIEKEPNGFSVLVESLSEEGRLKLLEGLTRVIPYKNVIDLFHKYLTHQNVS